MSIHNRLLLSPSPIQMMCFSFFSSSSSHVVFILDARNGNPIIIKSHFLLRCWIIYVEIDQQMIYLVEMNAHFNIHTANQMHYNSKSISINFERISKWRVCSNGIFLFILSLSLSFSASITVAYVQNVIVDTVCHKNQFKIQNRTKHFNNNLNTMMWFVYVSFCAISQLIHSER